MNSTQLIRKNISNLTDLWKTAGRAFNTLSQQEKLNHCVISDADWPNRLWLNQGNHDKNNIKAAIQKLSTSTTDLIFPFWDTNGRAETQFVEQLGGTLRFEQTGMSLKLDQPFKHQDRLQVVRITDKEKAQQWAEIYPKAFGYGITSEILNKTMNNIDYYLASYQDRPVGTAMLYHTGKIAGIHGVGIVPEVRRQGFANELMCIILNQAIEDGADYTTLQASSMGKGLYEKLGFDEQFMIYNYVL
ncbi:GNAT family N-acetyltransferase [Fodinibius halophilus]|uniref:GNAT family N-acetyltransferase n=1 Tax=Fodinibius halophilus TaxID=1736908 RepID=A0A6M1TEP8_9BACT|nr:GNAT family N-acetyltransferase [Fodinibius halophilus]NGP87120.1 GNAT family N-acetyltransferase [Fodinibius halophilus]